MTSFGQQQTPQAMGSVIARHEPGFRESRLGRGVRRTMLGLALCCLGFGAGAAAGSDWSVEGHAFARVLSGQDRPSWRSGDFGRLDVGGDSEGDDADIGMARLHATLNWRPSSSVGAYLHAVARAESEDLAGDSLALVEGYVEFEAPLDSAHRLRLRAGHFILPTSRENVDIGWSSPYTLTFSALNTWVGEEVRLTGIDTAYHLPLGNVDELRFTVSAFGGNDTAGTLLAWRGWAMGDRLTGFGETLPLPPLPGFMPGAGFETQQASGTTPFDSDLDGRVGYAGALRYQRPEKGAVQITFYDNRGDRKLHAGQYAWATRFYLAGADWTFRGPGGSFTLAAESLWGETGMGEPTGANVQQDYSAHYLLASWSRSAWRATLRWDDFETEDLDGSRTYDPNDGEGEAWTFALFFQPLESDWRFGLEAVDLTSERSAAGLVTPSVDTSGRSFSLELRYLF